MASRRRGRSELGDESKDESVNKQARTSSTMRRQPMADCDRFIPNRSAMDVDRGANTFLAVKENGDEGEVPHRSGSPTSACDVAAAEAFNAALECNILGEMSQSTVSDAGSVSEGMSQDGAGRGHRVLAFRNKAPMPSDGHLNSLKVLYSQAQGNGRGVAVNTSVRLSRHISSTPERMLDAPGMVDDYYLNLLSWGNNNLLAVALGPTVYLWDPATGQIEDLPCLEGDDDYVCSVNFIAEGGTHIAIGTCHGQTQLWDVTQRKQVRSMDGHSSRVSALSWNKHVVSSGGRDGNIVHHDVRVQRHAVRVLRGHTQEVCSLAWSPNGATLASGANDNLVNLWDASVASGDFGGVPRATLTDHCAAVKALAWCPFEANLLATGAGTADRCIKFWNGASGALLNSVDTGTQVCALQWSRTEKELLSSHGYIDNSLCLWKYPSMVKVKELKGHTKRVLHMAQSPDGQTVVSGAADETLRFWNVFAPAASKARKSASGGSSSSLGSGRVIGIR